MKQEIKSIHQSPMNEQRWLLVLMCGHEKWVTSVRRPKAQKTDCDQCSKVKPNA